MWARLAKKLIFYCIYTRLINWYFVVFNCTVILANQTPVTGTSVSRLPIIPCMNSRAQNLSLKWLWWMTHAGWALRWGLCQRIAGLGIRDEQDSIEANDSLVKSYSPLHLTFHFEVVVIFKSILETKNDSILLETKETIETMLLTVNLSTVLEKIETLENFNESTKVQSVSKNSLETQFMLSF